MVGERNWFSGRNTAKVSKHFALSRSILISSLVTTMFISFPDTPASYAFWK